MYVRVPWSQLLPENIFELEVLRMPAMPRFDVLAAVLIMSVAIPVAVECQNTPPRRAGPATSSAQAESFKTNVKLVLIPVSVTDENGANVK
jgi:hypothetical protein